MSEFWFFRKKQEKEVDVKVGDLRQTKEQNWLFVITNIAKGSYYHHVNIVWCSTLVATILPAKGRLISDSKLVSRIDNDFI